MRISSPLRLSHLLHIFIDEAFLVQLFKLIFQAHLLDVTFLSKINRFTLFGSFLINLF